MIRSHAPTLRTLLLAAALAALFLAGAAAALAQTPTAATTPPVPLEGKALYAQNCAPCHGEAGNGDGPSASGLGVGPTAFASYQAIAGKSLVELFETTKNGNMPRMMPPWKDRLDDQQIWDAVAYAWTLHTAPAQVEMGKAVYAANCATCHGPDGQGSATGPALTDFAKTSGVSQAAWAQVVANGRGNMPGFAGKLGDAEQAAVLEYARSLSFGGPMFRAALAAGTGVISGTVTNGTTAAVVPDIEVQLGIFDQTALLEQRSARTDSQGIYRFTGLPTDAGLTFVARVAYPASVGNSSEMRSFAAGESALDLPVAIYETTTDPSGIRADRVHFIIEPGAGQATITELLVFDLDGNRTYVGDANGVLRFTLPAGAQNLEVGGSDQSGRFQPTADGFADMQPLTPGRGVRTIQYRYTLPVTGNTLDLERTLLYPAANVNALLADQGEQVTSDQLANQGVLQTQAGPYISLIGRDLAANQPIAIRIAGLAASQASASTGSGALPGRALLFALIGLAAVGAAVLVALPLLRRGAAAPAPGPAARDALIDALARLDLAHQAGELSDAAYRDRRMQLKAELSDLLRREAADAGTGGQ